MDPPHNEINIAVRIITEGIVGNVSLTDGTFRLQEDVASNNDDEYNTK